MDGISMRPIDELDSRNDQTLFDFTLDELAIRNLWYSFSEEVFYIGKIEFDNPNVKLELPASGNTGRVEGEERKKSAVKELEEEIQKSVERINFKALFIREIEIRNADLFFFNFLSQNSLQAEDTRLYVKNINWTTLEEWETPFNAEGFEFDLHNVSFPLSDQVHTLQANYVNINSLDNQITIEGFTLTPDKTVESKAYYAVFLNKLAVGNVDLNTAFMTSEVKIDEIVLNQPDIRVERSEENRQDSVASGDLNELIEGVLKSIEIKELSVNGGKFLTSDVRDTLKNRIDIPQVDFKMIKFYLGDDRGRIFDQFFYGEDAAMEIRNASLYLSDGIHVINGDKVSVSSFKDEIEVENLTVTPIDNVLDSLNPDNIVKISLPGLLLSNANLKQLYNEGRLEVNEMKIQSPQVEVTERNPRPETAVQLHTQEVLQGYLDEISIKTLDLQDGEVQFTNEAGIRSDDIGFEKFSLLMEDILIRPGATTSISDILMAEEMVLSLDKYRLKLRDNLHVFLADRVVIDSKNSLVEISNFALRPENPEHIAEALDSYGKTVAFDLEVPKFRAEGIDLKAAFFDEKLQIKRILIPTPKASITRYRKGQEESLQNQMESSDQIKELLTDYFNSIQIDSLSFSGGKVRYTSYAGNRDVTFSDDDLSLNLRGFHVDNTLNLNQEKAFFSDEIDLSLNNYSFSIAGGNYRVSTGIVRFNSISQSILIDDLLLRPGPSIASKVVLSLRLPKVSFTGVDLESFLYDNELDLEKLSVEGSEISLEINRSVEAVKIDSENATLPKSIERVRVKEVEANNSTLKINYRVGKSDIESIQTDFNLGIKGLNLESETDAIQDLSSLFDEVDLSLKDFSFALPDSMHTIRFSTVTIDNTAEETVFTGFKIIPKNTFGKPGLPIFSASIDQVGLRNNTLKEVQETGTLDLTQIRLQNPTINLYLDSIENAASQKDKKEPKENAFVSSIFLRNLLIENGNVTLNSKETGPIPRLKFEGVNFGLEDINLDLMNRSSSLNSGFLLEKDLSLSVNNYTLYSPDSLNMVSVGKLSFLDGNLILDRITIRPTLGRYDYLRKKGFQTDAISGYVNKAVLEAVDVERLLSTKKLTAKVLRLEDFSLDVFRDKRMPAKAPEIRPMPQYLMQNSPVALNLDSVILTGGAMRYEEFSPRSMLPGYVLFDELHASIAPFVLVGKDDPYPIDSSSVVASAKIMGDGHVNLKGTMFFESPYPMDLEMEMGQFDLRLTNSILAPGVFVRIREGKVNSAKWNFRLTDVEAVGQMNLLYQDLKIQLLDSLTLQRGRGKLNVLSFLANTVIKKSNPRGFFGNQASSTIYFERDKSRFVFSTLWKATLSGLQGSVGLGNPKIPNRRKEDEN